MLRNVDLVQPATAPELYESALFNLIEDDPAILVVSAVGAYSCADIWFTVPTGINPKLVVNVYGRTGDARALLASFAGDGIPVATEGARDGALLGSIRGRPCSAFEIECLATTDITGVRVFLYAWHADVSHDVTRGSARRLTVDQGTPAAGTSRWPIALVDGSGAERGLVGSPVFTRLSDGAAAQGAVGAPLFVRLSDGTAALGSATPVSVVPQSARATYSVGSDRGLTLAAAANSTTILGSLWNPHATKRVEIHRLEISYWGASTSGAARVRVQRVSTQPALGTQITAQRHDPSDAAAVAAFRILSTAITFVADVCMFVVKPDARDQWVWSPQDAGKPIVLLQNQGIEIRAVTDTAMASAMTFGISMQWAEI